MAKTAARPKRKPRGKPFEKGNRANPHGRPRKALAVRLVEIDCRRYSREHGKEAVDKIIEVMRGRLVMDVGTPEAPKLQVVIASAATQLAAAAELLDRGYGKPPQAVEIAGKDGGPIVTVSSAYDIICSRIDSIAARLAEGEGEEGPPRLTN